MAVLFALLAAASYGASDFAGGLGGRRAAPGAVAALSAGVALVVAACVTALHPAAGPTAPVLGWGAVAGLGSGVGTLALYRGLAGGRMSVVAPLSAVLSALVPALVGVATGDRLTGPAWAGVAIALPAIALVSVERSGAAPRSGPPDGAGRRGSIRDGLLAGAGFGVLFAALGRAGTDSGTWPLVPTQAVAVLVVLGLAGGRRRGRTGRRGRGRWRSAARPGAVAGVLGAGATISYLAATGHGPLAVVAVLTALYPAVTVLLARVVLGERWGRVQGVGMVIAALAVVLVSTG